MLIYIYIYVYVYIYIHIYIYIYIGGVCLALEYTPTDEVYRVVPPNSKLVYKSHYNPFVTLWQTYNKTIEHGLLIIDLPINTYRPRGLPKPRIE